MGVRVGIVARSAYDLAGSCNYLASTRIMVQTMRSGALSKPPSALLRNAALFLDFDGTLVDLAPQPDAVVVDDRLRRLMAQLGTAMPGRVAIISGRSVAAIRDLLGELPHAVGGSHGLELRWADGRTVLPERPASLNRIIAAMQQFADRNPGTLVEIKPFGAALHYRLAPDAGDAADELAASLAAETGLHRQTGKMMVELRSGDADKGTALTRFMADPALAGRYPVFIGDDDTDEPAFAAAAALGGAGILVGEPRATSAAYGLPDVAATLDWLENAA